MNKSARSQILRRLAPVLLLVVTACAQPAAALPEAVPVLRVIDGDTVDVRIDGRPGRVRLIGLDTPETVDPRKPVQCFGREASAHLHELLDGQSVTVELDPTQGERDRYGRSLVYLRLADGTNVAERMIAEGYGHEYTYRRPYLYRAQFRAAQKHAQDSGAGLWNAATCGGVTS